MVFSTACLLAVAMSVSGGPQADAALEQPTAVISIRPEVQALLASHDLPRVLAWIASQKDAGQGVDAAGQLRLALRSKDAATRWQAARVLPRLGDDASAALPELRKAIDDVDPLVRWAAAGAVRDIAPSQPDGLAILLPILEDDDPLVRWAALEAITTVGPKARGVVPVLVQLLDDEHIVVRREAAHALRSVVPGLPAIGMIEAADVQEALRF